MIDLETMSILVVDDMKSMRLTIRKMLRNLNIGKVLLFAENGKQGLEVLSSTPCDLVIVDWNMPIMNGSEMLTHLRHDKRLRDLPVIMVTAENVRDIVSEVAEYEINAYLLKPLTLGALDTKIKAVVNRVNNPEKTTLYLLKARAFEEAGNIESAIDQIRLALAEKPSASRLLRKLGLLHFKIGKAAIGEKCLQKAVSVNPEDFISRDRLAQVYIKKKQYQNAARIYLEILKLSNKYFGSATRLGETLMNNGFRQEAIQLFAMVMSRCRRNNALKEKIIDICVENNEFEFVIQSIEQLLKENPSNYDLMFKAGLVYIETGNLEKALSYFRTIDSSKKGDVDAKLQIAKICYINKRVIQADEYLRQVLRIDPGNESAISMRQNL